MPNVTSQPDRELHLEVKHTVARAINRVLGPSIIKTFTEKRKSNHPSNIAGRQLKFWIYTSGAPSEERALKREMGDVLAQYNLTCQLSSNYLYVLRKTAM